MRVLSVNVGAEARLPGARRAERTGIYKRPVEGPVRITPEGLSGDAIVNTRHHGGADQAVYLYGAPDYAWWSGELGRELEPGTFGENLTVEGLESGVFSIGDRLHLGSVVLEVTAPRIPCGTLARRMADSRFVERFMEAERPGLYCRVLEEGEVRAGDGVRVEPYTGECVPVLELFRGFFEPARDAEALRRHLAAPIAERARAIKERQLRDLEG